MKNAMATGKHKSPDTDPVSNAAPNKMSLSKTFKASMTSKVHLSDQEADFLVNNTRTIGDPGLLDKKLGPEYTGSRSIDK